MNIFKFSLSSFIIILCVFFSQFVSAATEKVSQPVVNKAPGVLVASVNIKNAKIVFQDGKSFKISFTLTNGEGIQTGVKYGVKLFTDDKNQSLVDEKVYDETLSLNENSSVSREFTYTPPAILNGNFVILLESKNESNFPFASYVVGKIKLTSSIKWVQLEPDTCYTQISGDKINKHYSTFELPEISSDQSLNINCVAINNSDDAISVTPTFDTRYSGSFGQYAPQSDVAQNLISFKKGEKKNISIEVPKGDMPKPYSVKLSLTDGEKSSNAISFGYIIKGISATIQKASLDKDYYKTGESAELSLVWFSAGLFNNKPPKIIVDTTIENSRGWQCADANRQTISKDPSKPVDKIILAIKNTCDDPHVKISLTGQDGKVLDQKEFAFKTSKPRTNETGTVNKKYLAVSIAVLIIIAGFGIYTSRKKKINNVNM